MYYVQYKGNLSKNAAFHLEVLFAEKGEHSTERDEWKSAQEE